MNIRFYKGFSKRKNSTKRPGGSVLYDDRDCRLKNATSIENPEILLSGTKARRTLSGNPITADNAQDDPVEFLTIEFSPTQSYNGYDRPWAPGAGKNKFDISRITNQTITTVDYTRSDGGIVLDAGVYYTISIGKTISSIGVYYYGGGTDPGNRLEYNAGTSYVTFMSPTTVTVFIRLYNSSGDGGITNDDIDTIQLEVGNTVTSFAPYTNACPISGRTQSDITVNGTTTTVTYGQTVYGGGTNVKEGGTWSIWNYIASYAGEALPGEWLSSYDLYAPGTQPTTGAEVVYKVTTPSVINTPAYSIILQDGTNTLSTDADIINLTYLTVSSMAYDYAYIDDFKKYYFIRDRIITSNNLIQYELEEDTLASRKTEIGATVARIAFAATGWDKDIVDPRCLVKTTKIKYDTSAATELTTTGCYVLTVFNKTSGASNGLGATYVLDAGNMQKVKEWMGDDTVYQALVNYFGGSPMESIFACIWVPFSYAANPGAGVSVINIGNQDSTLYGITAYVISGTGILSGTEVLITIPYRYNDFRDASPYSDAQLYLPGVGNVDINLNDFLDSTKIHILYSMEYGTGDLTYYIKDDSGNLIQTVSCNVASQCPLGQLNINGGGIVSSIGSAAGGVAALTFGAASGNAAMATAGAGALLASASSAVLSYNKRSVSLKGTLGGRTSTEITDIIFTGYYMDTEDVDSANYIATHGRPVGVTHAISSHSGYVQCDNASVVMSGSVLERDRINDYLNSGFFYE